jgi:hypothetical protein
MAVNLRAFEDLGLDKSLDPGIEALFLLLRTEGEKKLACKRLSKHSGLSQKKSVLPC